MVDYEPDDIIILAEKNPGFGFKRFCNELCGKKKNSTGEGVILRLFDIHRKETKNDLFKHLQSPDKVRMVNREEWWKITNNAPIPRGYGGTRTGGIEKNSKNMSKVKLIPLPPQYFDWHDITPINEKKSKEKYIKLRGNTLIHLMDFELLLKLHEKEMMTLDQISEKLDIPINRIRNFIQKIEKLDQYGIANEWLRVITKLWEIQNHRGHTHLEDELMMDLRLIFENYIKDPINNETPLIDDVSWVYSQLLLEEIEDKKEEEIKIEDKEEDEKQDKTSQITLLEVCTALGMNERFLEGDKFIQSLINSETIADVENLEVLITKINENLSKDTQIDQDK